MFYAKNFHGDIIVRKHPPRRYAGLRQKEAKNIVKITNIGRKLVPKHTATEGDVAHCKCFKIQAFGAKLETIWKGKKNAHRATNFFLSASIRGGGRPPIEA